MGTDRGTDPARTGRDLEAIVGAPLLPSLVTPRIVQAVRWLRAPRQRSVRKFSADKLARIVRIILQGLPVLTAASGLSCHNLFPSFSTLPLHPLALFFFLFASCLSSPSLSFPASFQRPGLEAAGPEGEARRMREYVSAR